MIKNLLMDMGNVLMTFSPEYILSHYTTDIEAIELLKQRIFYSGLWAKLDNGDMTFEEACEIALHEVPEIDSEIIRGLFSTWSQYKVEDKRMTELVKSLKEKGYQLYLASNAASTFRSYIDKYDVFQYFDGILISADIQISKPDPRFYTHLLETFELKKEESLFVDDSIANIKTASDLGIYTFHYSGNIEAFKQYLVNINVL